MTQDEKLRCPSCDSDRVTLTSEQVFMANTGEHYCHSVKTHDSDAKAGCIYCGWQGRRYDLKGMTMTSEKERPTGFVATCRCGVVVGAMDYLLTDQKQAGSTVGKWLNDGCTVEPRFDLTWSVDVKSCRCVAASVEKEK